MNFMEQIAAKWNAMSEKMRPILETVADFFADLADVFKGIGKSFFKMRKVILSIPVIMGAVVLAFYNQTHLPAVVGLDLQANGEFTFQLIREVAVLAPLAVTAVSLMLLICARRVLTPWLVSMCTLLLPVIILIMNTFPA